MMPSSSSSSNNNNKNNTRRTLFSSRTTAAAAVFFCVSLLSSPFLQPVASFSPAHHIVHPSALADLSTHWSVFVSQHLSTVSPDSFSTVGAGTEHVVVVVTQQQSLATSSHNLLAQAASSTATSNGGVNNKPFETALTWYRQSLKSNPMPTKVGTGVVLAVVGDALAQKMRDNNDSYNVKRAVSFAVFDGCYRAVQQITYPPMMQVCSGAFTTTLLHNINLWGGILGMDATGTVSAAQQHVYAAVEQTLVSQLVIIPLLYYPVFFAVTGAVQGLTLEQTVTRARDSFVPLMRRNLQFWIPVQFCAFEFLEENVQIPVLIVCGLVWTIILSLAAGSATTPAPTPAAAGDTNAQVVSGEELMMEDPATEMVHAAVTTQISGGMAKNATSTADATPVAERLDWKVLKEQRNDKQQVEGTSSSSSSSSSLAKEEDQLNIEASYGNRTR